MEKQACTTAIHAKDGNNHCVTLSALRVMLLEDSSGWLAQDAWKEFYHMPKNADCQTYSCIEFHKIDEEIGDKTGSMKLPFDQIAFLSQQPQQQREAVLA